MASCLRAERCGLALGEREDLTSVLFSSDRSTRPSPRREPPVSITRLDSNARSPFVAPHLARARGVAASTPRVGFARARRSALGASRPAGPRARPRGASRGRLVRDGGPFAAQIPRGAERVGRGGERAAHGEGSRGVRGHVPPRRRAERPAQAQDRGRAPPSARASRRDATVAPPRDDDALASVAALAARVRLAPDRAPDAERPRPSSSASARRTPREVELAAAAFAAAAAARAKPKPTAPPAPLDDGRAREEKKRDDEGLRSTQAPAENREAKDSPPRRSRGVAWEAPSEPSRAASEPSRGEGEPSRAASEPRARRGRAEPRRALAFAAAPVSRLRRRRRLSLSLLLLLRRRRPLLPLGVGRLVRAP